MGFLLVLEYHDNVAYYMANYFEFDINFKIISFRLDFKSVFITMIFKLKMHINICTGVLLFLFQTNCIHCSNAHMSF